VNKVNKAKLVVRLIIAAVGVATCGLLLTGSEQQGCTDWAVCWLAQIGPGAAEVMLWILTAVTAMVVLLTLITGRPDGKN
jgi:hypothetical protein